MTSSPPLAGQLRVSYIWRDEVMSDEVVAEPGPVTLGTTAASKITVPDLGLPANFAILRPGSRGYLITLSKQMSGRISIGGREMAVEEFLAEPHSGEGTPSDFKGKGIAPGDWGVITLDNAGDHSIFFQFVKPSGPLEKAPLIRDPDMLWPSFGIAFLLVGFFLTYAFWLHSGEGLGFVWPGNREMVANYLLTRPPPAAELEPEEEVKAGTEDGAEKAKAASTAGIEAKAGGEGQEERKRAPDPDKGEPDEALPERVETALQPRRKYIEKVRDRGGFDKKLGKALARLSGPAKGGSDLGFGKGKGTGVGRGAGTGTTTKGTGKGTGGGGKAHQDVRTQRAIKTGGKRAAKGTPSGKGVKEKTVKVKTGKPSGRFGGLTQAQIMKVVRSRARAIQACYARELQRNKGLSGKIVVNWRITSSGKVARAKVRSTSMRNARVQDCIVREVQRMKFPSPKGGGSAQVNFPFIFGAR